MRLESLSNELWLNVFDYLAPLDLFRAFRGLNLRIETLLFVNYQDYRIDFRSLNWKNFHLLSRDCIPSIVNRITSLHLSDDQMVRGQAFEFLSSSIDLSQFTSLRSLTLNNARYHPKLEEFFASKIQHLQHLTHLKLIHCAFSDLTEEQLIRLNDQIWGLSKLTFCHWDVNLKDRIPFPLPTIVSPSLEHLFIDRGRWKHNQLIRLMAKTPRLRYFSTNFPLISHSDDEYDIDVDDQPVASPSNVSMRTLKLSKINSQKMMHDLFFSMPNLTSLHLHTFLMYLDGYQWHRLIVDYFPQLKELRFTSSFEFPDQKTKKEKQIDRLLDTFRQPFWIEQRRWFVGCLWKDSIEDQHICLYSMPFAFENYFINERQVPWLSKTTCDASTPSFSYDHVRCYDYDPSMHSRTELASIEFHRVEDIQVRFPFDQRFLTLFPHFDHLRALTVLIATHPPVQLQALLDRMPRLVSLSFAKWFTKETPPFDLTSRSVRSLDLQGVNQAPQRHRFTKEQCQQLIQSPLGMQCEELRLEVEDIKQVITLAYKMVNLRVMYVKYFYDSQSHRPESVKLLRSYLPSRVTVFRCYYGELVIRF